MAWGVSGDAAERGDDSVVDAADADGGVAQVDEGVAGGGEGSAQGHGLAGADFPGDHAEGVLAGAPADPGGRLAVGGVAVQHARCQVTAERHFGEAVMGEELERQARKDSSNLTREWTLPRPYRTR